jgi:hypothetical protein
MNTPTPATPAPALHEWDLHEWGQVLQYDRLLTLAGAEDVALQDLTPLQGVGVMSVRKNRLLANQAQRGHA